MALEFVQTLLPRDFYRESQWGYAADLAYTPSGDLGGLPLPKLADQGYTALVNIPGALTVGTGLTFKFLLVDDGKSADDLGKVVRIGITVKRVVSGSDNLDVDTNAATEVTADVTLDATSGEVVITSTAIANAALDSVVTGNVFALRVRRIGDHANDTCQGRAILLAMYVLNT